MTTRRVRHLLQQGQLRPSVEHFLKTGDTSAARAENPWLEFLLLFDGAKVREALAADDLAVRAAILAKIPGSKGLFV
jgi:hypothetical protein